MKVKSAGNSAGRAGQSVLELLIALAIIVMSISAGISVFFGGQSLEFDARFSNRAMYLARALLEEARNKAKLNFAELANSTTTDGEYTESLAVENIDAYTKRITAKVSWQTDPLRPQGVELVSILTDWRHVSPPPDPNDTGGGGIAGNWQNPRTLGSVDLGPGNSATDLDVINKIVYITAEASASGKPDFFVIDATNGQDPFVVSSLNTGPGLNAIDVSGNYAYVANNQSSRQLQVIDVSNRSSPVVLFSATLPGISEEALSIFYSNSRVYVGTDRGGGPEFHIFDVSNPSNPVALGSKEIGYKVKDIYVSNNLAYLATDADDELKVYDVLNPANIVLVNYFNVSGSCEDGRSLYLVSNKLYFGRTDPCGHNSHHKFSILDIATTSSIQSLGSTNIGADVNGIAVRDNLAFLGTSDSNKEFQIWNVSNPGSIGLWSSFNFPQVATGVDYEDNFVYVSVRSNDALRIITSSP